MKIKTERVKTQDLKPGDLFNNADQFYWDHRDPSSVAERVYIRTDAPVSEDDKETTTFRITIIKQGEPMTGTDISNLLTPEARAQGLALVEIDKDVVELRLKGKRISSWSQRTFTLDDILKDCIKEFKN